MKQTNPYLDKGRLSGHSKQIMDNLGNKVQISSNLVECSINKVNNKD